MALKIAVVSSCGGHLDEVRLLLDSYSRYEYYYVINHPLNAEPEVATRLNYLTHSERDWKFFINLMESYRIVRSNGCDIVLSTGAGPAVPFSLVAKFMFGARIVFVESFTRVLRPSLTGRLIYLFADYFYYQWSPLVKFFPKGVYLGPLV